MRKQKYNKIINNNHNKSLINKYKKSIKKSKGFKYMRMKTMIMMMVLMMTMIMMNIMIVKASLLKQKNRKIKKVGNPENSKMDLIYRNIREKIKII